VKTHMEMHFHAPFAARPVVPLGGAEARVTLASVGELSMSSCLCRAGRRAVPGSFRLAGWSPDQAATPGQGTQIRPIEAARPTLVAAGCDPALPLLETRSGCLIRRLRSTGGRAPAEKHPGWPPTGSYTSPGRTCADQVASTTSARPQVVGGRMGDRIRLLRASDGIPCPRLSTEPSANPQVRARKALLMVSAPSRIRTCAHGSGGQFDLIL
jgi:hypothetical protein